MALTRIRRSNGTVGGGRVAWAGTVVSALLLLLMPFLVLVGGSSAARGRANVQVTVCTAHLGQLAAGIRAYATENDDRLPKGADWCEAIQGHMRGAQAFRCPACPPGERCAYAFNAALSGVARATVAAPAETVLLFESAGGWNASGGLELVLARPRHPGGVGVAFADGHAEMVSPARLPSLRWTP
jgi:prepilin-type processing-associated H-X9-DG protein